MFFFRLSLPQKYPSLLTAEPASHVSVPPPRAKTFLLCLIVLLTSFVPVATIAQTKNQVQYTRRVWHIQDGLPEEPVQAIRQTSDGFLWIGTAGGLVRFDGYRFTRSLQPWHNTSLTDDSTFCILTASDGSLWIGTEGEGLLHFQSGVFRTYTTPDGLTDGFVRSVVEDSQKRIWVGTSTLR